MCNNHEVTPIGKDTHSHTYTHINTSWCHSHRNNKKTRSYFQPTHSSRPQKRFTKHAVNLSENDNDEDEPCTREIYVKYTPPLPTGARTQTHTHTRTSFGQVIKWRLCVKWFHPHFCLQADHKCPSPNLQLTQTDSPPAGEFSHKSTYSYTPPPITQQQQQKQSRFFLLTQWTPHLDSLADPLQAGLNMQLWEDGAAWAEQWTEQLRLGEDECVCVCVWRSERER